MAPKVRRRPAAEPRRIGVLRRPAVAEDEVRGEGPAVVEELGIGKMVHGSTATYYGVPCQFAGKVIEDARDASGRYLMIKLTGTNLESLLTWGTGSRQLAKVHMCTPECNKEAEGPGLLHCQEARVVGGLHELADLPWRDVLVSAVDRGDDELAGLRGRMEDLPGPAAEGAQPGVAESAKEKEASKEAVKKKKKKEKRRRRSSESSDRKRRKRGRSRVSRSRGGDKKKEKKKKKVEAIGGASPVRSSSSSSTSETRGYAAVEQKTMFAMSGLDPSRRVRNRLKRKAQRYAQRKGRSKSESRSKSSESEVPQKGESIFGEPHKIRAVGVSFPGVLSAAAIEDMQELMLLEAGQESAQPEGWVPTLLRYYRQMLSRRVSGPMARELHTLCTVGDQILRGQLPSALDTLIQRVKSLEAQISGLPWASAHRLELLPSDTATISTRQELRIATTEQKAEAQAHQPGGWWSKGSGKEPHKGDKVEKGKGKGKKGKDKQKKDP